MLEGIQLFLGSLSPIGILFAVIGFLIVITIIVFVHELGHFLVARWCGVTVTTFSLGFGRELAGFTDRKGTRWRISALPFGGYVKFLGDENAASVADQEELARLTAEQRKRTLAGQPVAKRAAVVAAGPFANFILAILIIAAVAAFYGIENQDPRIDSVTPGTVAAEAGFQPGDVVRSIDGRRIGDFAEVRTLIATHAERPLTFVVERDGDAVTIEVAPERRTLNDPFGNPQSLGALDIGGPALPARIRAVMPGSPADRAGLQPGDRIISIDGNPIATFDELREIVTAAPGRTLAMTAERGAGEVSLAAIPDAVKERNAAGEEVTLGRLGVTGTYEIRTYGPFESLGIGVTRTWGTITGTLSYLGQIVIGRESAEQLGGPLRVAQIAGQATQTSWDQADISYIVLLIAFISISIGLMNLFPIPMLDGGHLMFYAFEAVLGRPLSERAQDIGFRIGFTAVIMLMIFATFNDISAFVRNIAS